MIRYFKMKHKEIKLKLKLKLAFYGFMEQLVNLIENKDFQENTPKGGTQTHE